MVQTCHAGTLSWHSLVEMGLPHSALWDVANAVHLLFSDTDMMDQSTQSMLTILEELIGITFYQLHSTSQLTHKTPMSAKRSLPLFVPVSSSPLVIPQQWHVENVARLLLLCESSLCYTILASKAINGRLFEVSRLLVHIVLVSVLRPINNN